MIAVVRLRGSIKVPGEIEDTLRMLKLKRVNHARVLKEDASILGMVKKSKDYITWGEISQEVLLELLRKRGRIEGDKKITQEWLSKTKYKSLEELANAVYNNQTELSALKIKPTFRLHPPKKGHEGIKRTFKQKGALGYRGSNVNKLLLRMI